MVRIPDALMPGLQGIVPSGMVTVGADGVPNTTYISQVFPVGATRVATSFQFFNKTRANLQTNPLASLSIIDPTCGAYWRVAVRYTHTETEGELFEDMEMQLEAIASMQGMADIFVLRGADVFEVLEVEQLTGQS